MLASNIRYGCILLAVLVFFVFIGEGAAKDSKKIDYGIVSSFASPGPSPQGLAWDGMHLWLADDSTDTIYKINPLNGFVDFSFSSPGLEPGGLTYEGTYLWNIDNNSGRIFKLNPENGSIIEFLELPSEDNNMNIEGCPFTGLTWDGKYLWSAYLAGWSSSVVRIDPENGIIDTSFSCDAEDLAFDGTYLWNVDSQYGHAQGIVKKRELPSGTEIAWFSLPVFYPTGLTFDGSYFWLADSGADTLYQIQLTTTSVEESGESFENTPYHFILHQNYPNSFNSATTIRYTIEKPSYVCLTIFDVIGRKVRQLTNQQLSAGQYGIRWDGKDKHEKEVSSGLYLCVLKVGSFSKTKRMMLVR